MKKAALAAIGVALSTIAVPAAAEDLFTVWSLSPRWESTEVDVSEDVPFLEMQLRPLRLVRLTEPAQISRDDQLAVGTFLFIVFQEDGQFAYCTIKDQSNANAARSLFIPMMDRRPCLVDADNNGQFEARFSVFDKYGSALTPSGNLSSARELSAPASYEIVDPALFPVSRSLAFSVTSMDNTATRALSVSYDNGRGYVPMVNHSPDSTPDRPTALNVAAQVLSSTGETGRVRIIIDRDQYVVGDSDGDFVVTPLPPYAANIQGQ